jgi:hypothetical protein
VNPSGDDVAHLLVRNARAAMDQRATYRIVVRGELDPRFAYLFNGLQMEPIEGTTVLTGSVIDQAQLYGIIGRIEELRLELLSVAQTSAATH